MTFLHEYFHTVLGGNLKDNYSEDYPGDVVNRKTLCLIQLSTLGMLFLAALGAYSRVYLSQHFMWDITIGSIIGFVTPFLVFHFGKDKILKLKNKLYNIRNEEISK